MKFQVALISLAIVTVCHVSFGAISFGIGECPSGHIPGDTWSSEGACEHCDCKDGSFVCSSCGVYAIQLDATQCYHYRDLTKAYPDCCTPIIKCRGDLGFNETLLQH